MNNSIEQTDIEFTRLNKKYQKNIKRIFDIVVSFIALVILSPVFLVLALLIIKEDGRPFFFRQKRSGIYDTVFEMYKFRSMKNNQVSVPSNSHNDYKWKNGVPDDFVFKAGSEENPNITKIGKFIRKYSLDELPQFLNVLKGDMSIIGPRPEIIPISRCYNEHQRKRLAVKPGITGWAQANGRSDIDHGKKIEYDLYYVENFSLWLDFKVFFRTLVQVFGGKGSV
ncbi:sugar transferase [Virgibacillus halodenitrificans]|uniref:sugar transferase n=1 Tax=Virgibacillus halodenitrificans TaxID=1482 RepID=UPI001FB4E14E|nr:sugar transferase [Virgibacillus halodenitrificans]MCJ0929727.1 sugar transferase [Virgibacillus halodenitrificans]